MSYGDPEGRPESVDQAADRLVRELVAGPLGAVPLSDADASKLRGVFAAMSEAGRLVDARHPNLRRWAHDATPLARAQVSRFLARQLHRHMWAVGFGSEPEPAPEDTYWRELEGALKADAEVPASKPERARKVPAAAERELVTVAEAASMVAGRRSEVVRAFETAGLIVVTPFGPRVAVAALREWATSFKAPGRVVPLRPRAAARPGRGGR